MSASDPNLPEPRRPRRTVDRCAECGEALGHDQRYCVACGARRAALPTRIAVALSDLADRHRSGAAPLDDAGDPADPDAPGAAADEPDGADGRGDDEAGPVGDAPGEAPPERSIIPLARAAAVSILLMLGVGSLIGAATTPGGVTSLASTIVVALSPHHLLGTPAASVSPGGGSGGGGGASSGGGGGGGGGSTATAAPQVARTVTLASGPTAPGGGPTTGTSTTSAPTGTALPPIHHVWEIVLSGQGYDQSFGTTAGHPYLSRTLADQGTVLGDYDAVAGSPLANEIALISGQGPTPQTLQDCPQYSELVPGRIGRQGQARGDGCLYPASTPTLGSELEVQGDRWRAFIQGIGDPGQTTSSTTSSTTTGATATPTTTAGAPTPTTTSSTTTPATTTGTTTTGSTTTSTTSSSAPAVTDTSTASGCPHPAAGATDPGAASAGDGYVTWKNPWVYFHSVIDATTCAHDDVGLGALKASLRSENATPAFSYIAPDPCDDGSDTPCTAGAKAGLGPADTFLKSVVPEIERSAAYRAGGLILVTFDEAPQSGPDSSSASCCGQPTYPNLAGATATSSTSTTATTSTTPAVPVTPTTSTTTATPTPTDTATTSAGSTTTTSSSSCTATTTTPTTPTTTSTSTSTTTTTAATTSGCGPVVTGDPPGGGQVGLLMISPYVKAAQIDEVHIYNHFSLLKTLAELFGVTPPGYADDSTIPALSPSLFLTTKR